MSRRPRTRNLLCFFSLRIFSDPGLAHSQNLPNVAILATGGTIAGAAESGTQAGYKSGAVTIDAMLAAVPGIRNSPASRASRSRTSARRT